MQSIWWKSRQWFVIIFILYEFHFLTLHSMQILYLMSITVVHVTMQYLETEKNIYFCNSSTW